VGTDDPIDWSGGGKPPTPPTVEGPSRPATRPSEVDAAERNPGSAFGHFVLLRQVGQGGMGTVYRAWNRTLNRIVALKMIPGGDPESVARFVREAQIAARLDHPAIAKVYEAGEVGGRHYIAMQFIDGVPSDRTPRPLDRTLALIRDVARALAYAHEQGVIHRDIKPSNLLASPDGAVYLTDFGTAKEVQADLGSHLSLTGTIIGTPQFMPPEQVNGKTRHVDARSDVYGLGATLFALLAGRPPFDHRNIGDLLMAVTKKRPPRVGTFNSAASPELEDFIDRSLSKDPARRPASATAFADELDRMLREKRYTGRYGLARLLVRRWAPWAAAAVVLGVALRYGGARLLEPDPRAADGSLTPAERYRIASQNLASISRRSNR